ncbi:MAG: phasin family protein [Sphingomonas sp.]
MSEESIVASKSPQAKTPNKTARPAVRRAPKAAAQPVAARQPAASADIKTDTLAEAPRLAASKDTETMNDTVKKATAKAETLFAEFNDRAKAAMEKGSKAFEEFNDFAKGNVEAVVESSTIAAKGFEAFGQDAAEYGRKSFENATAAVKAFAGAKSPTDFFKLQSDYVRSAFDALVAETSKNSEALLKLAGDVAQPLSNRAAVAVEKIKVAA